MAGANRGQEMGSFTENDGLPIGKGQFFIALDPKMVSGGLFDNLGFGTYIIVAAAAYLAFKGVVRFLGRS